METQTAVKVVAFEDSGWMNDHPLAVIEFKYLLHVDDEGPDNFVYILGRQNGDFDMPRHSHNFDQIRFPIVGDMNIGDGIVLREKTLGYFVEGLPYGPQRDPLGDAKPGERLQLVLQFGGASGQGFMPMAERRRARMELSRTGRFEGNDYVHADGKHEWALNAIWRHVYGRGIRHVRPRYSSVVIADPANFRWVPDAGNPGVFSKHLGTFTERQVRVELQRIERGGRWHLHALPGRTLLVALLGAGHVAGGRYSYLTAVQLEKDESCVFEAAEATELLAITLPPFAWHSLN